MSASTERAAALAELLARELTDDEIQRIAAATAALVTENAALGDVPEMMRPMDQQEAAAWLGVHRSTLSQWTGQDDDPAPAFRLGDKPVYVKAHLLRWLQARPYRASVVA